MSDEFTFRLPFSLSAIDRDAAGRSADIETFVKDPTARTVVLHGGRVLLKTSDPGHPDKASTRPLLLSPAEVPAKSLLVYLGRSMRDGAPMLATVLDEGAAEALLSSGEFEPGLVWGDLRQLGTELEDQDAGLLIQALAMANWHASGEFSPRSGTPTQVSQAGWVRRDPDTGAEIFPRTDPAIIVGVRSQDDRLLLGRNALWGEGRFSVLAGFVEPGESLEAAVIREVKEETGLDVIDPEYLGSQPWPFPASIMLGFRAVVAPGVDPTPVPDGEEISELRWFTREELAEASRSGAIKLPGRVSISRAIVDDWFGADFDFGQW